MAITGDGADSAKSTDSRATIEALYDTISRWAPRSLSRIAQGLDTAIALDDGTHQIWSVRIKRGRISMKRGRSRRVETTVFADPQTLISVVEGKASGVEAFLDGRLQVRGNLSLSLKLDALFQRPGQPRRFPRPARTTAGGIDTFYLDAGEGPPIIMLHGLGATNASMLPSLWEFAEDHRVIAPDLPGFGDSGKPFRAYTAKYYGKWLTQFMDALGIHRATLIGNSMGGRISLEVALKAPDRVSRIALYAPSMAFRRFRQFTPLVRTLAPELGVLPHAPPRIQVHQILRMLFSRAERVPVSWHEAAVDEFLRVWSSPRGRVAFYSAARQIYLEAPFGEQGFWDRLGRLRVPSLFIWGEKDWLVPSDFSRHIHGLERSRSVVLEDCGHVPQLERPAETNALVRQFFSDHPIR